MSFMQCELRCHILDRKDQLESAKHSRKYLEEKRKSLLDAVEKAKDDLDKHVKRIKRRESFIALVESTLDEHWIERPDLVEKEWFSKEEIQ